jgi:UDP-glucose 4-epimerase
MNDLARRVIALANSSSAISHVPYEKAYGIAFDDLPRRVPDLTKIKNAIGFTPHYSLDQIIKSVLDEQGGKK